MPTLSKSLCQCGGIRTAGLCNRCGAKARQGHTRSRHERGYDSQWTRLATRTRKSIPLCVCCWSRGMTTLAQATHHIVKIRDAPHLRLEPDNLATVCDACHAELDSLYESDRIAYDSIAKTIRDARDELT